MALGSAQGSRMRRYWDERAQEDAFFFVDSRLQYGDPDLESFWKGGEEALERMAEATGMRVEPGDRIVEVGCGVGRITRPIAERASEVWAVEVSPQMLELAEAHNGHLDNVHWVLGDGESLAGIEDASVDGCFSLVVFQHIPDPEVVLGYVREFGRVLRPGGWAAFQVSNDPSIHRPPGPIARARAAVAAKLRRAPSGLTDPAWLGTAIDLDRLRGTAAEAGLELERVYGAGTQYCLVGARRLP